MSTPNIAGTIEFLEAQLAALDEKRVRIIAALNGLRELADDEAPKKAKPQRPQSPAPPVTTEAGPAKQVIDYLTKHGPTSPGDLAKALGLSVSGASYHVKKLEAAKKVTVSGETASRRVALA